MMRILVLLFVIFAGHGAMAQGWKTSLTVTGSETFSDQTSGQRSTYATNDFGAYFVADSFADGATCNTTNMFEVDYFFGIAETWETQVLFAMEKRGDEFAVLDPAIYFSTLDQSDNPVVTYYGNSDLQVSVARLKCRPDGRFQMAIEFQGELPVDGFDAQGSVSVVGTADATLTFQDIDDY